jgi:hypothetical protein
MLCSCLYLCYVHVYIYVMLCYVHVYIYVMLCSCLYLCYVMLCSCLYLCYVMFMFIFMLCYVMLCYVHVYIYVMLCSCLYFSAQSFPKLRGTQLNVTEMNNETWTLRFNRETSFSFLVSRHRYSISFNLILISTLL